LALGTLAGTPNLLWTTKKNYVLGVIPTRTLICHSFWHTIWKYLEMYMDTRSD
jgi:hypothetical protein